MGGGTAGRYTREPKGIWNCLVRCRQHCSSCFWRWVPVGSPNPPLCRGLVMVRPRGRNGTGSPGSCPPRQLSSRLKTSRFLATPSFLCLHQSTIFHGLTRNSTTSKRSSSSLLLQARANAPGPRVGNLQSWGLLLLQKRLASIIRDSFSCFKVREWPRAVSTFKPMPISCAQKFVANRHFVPVL